MSISVKPVTRKERVLLNDAAIREALIVEISQQGWDAVTASAVARSANVSVGALYARAETLAELANEMWVVELSPEIRQIVVDIYQALQDHDPNRLIQVSAMMRKNRLRVSVALELVVAALFDDELEEVIGADFRSSLTPFATSSEGTTAVHAAAFTLSLGFMLGQALARRHGRVPPLTRVEADLHCAFWTAERVDCDDRLQIELEPLRIDNEANPVASGILSVIARRGYRRATVARMARASGLTPGAIFAGAHSKAELVAQAANSALLSPIEVWKQYHPLLERHGSAVARALFLREYMSPAHRDYWRVALELARVGELERALDSFKTPSDPLQRTHLAMALLAAYLPDAWSLPFQGLFEKGSAT